MAIDRTQRQRFELKYVVPEDVALGVRDFVQAYLRLDEYGALQDNLSYPVHSLYLDSDDLKLYRSTINGEKNRYKMRLRFYEDWTDGPVYFEVKRRNDNAISKLRAKVRREAADIIIAGHAPAFEDLAEPTDEGLGAALEFHRRLMALRAGPVAHVSYLREAWETDEGNAVRVTFDRKVASEPRYEVELSPYMSNPTYVFGDAVVLELKFTDRFPNWMRDMVRIFNLRQRSAGKYVDGLAETPAEAMSPMHAIYV